MKLARPHVILIALVLAVGIGAFFALKKKGGVLVGGSSEVEVPAFYDWNLATGPVAEEARLLSTERLVDMGQQGRYIYRLAKNIEVKGEKAKIELKDAIYWTDQKQLTAEHVADAFARATQAVRDGDATVEGDEREWVNSVKVKVVDNLNLEVTGFGSPESLSKLVKSRYLIPIRKDLLAAPETSSQAWLTTIGRYKLAAMPAKTMPKDSVLEFVPNPAYYRGAANETVKLALDKLVETAR